MSIKSIGGNTITTPLAKTNDTTDKTTFNGSTQNQANIRAIGFMLKQLAGKVVELVEPQPSGDLKQEAKKLIERHTSSGWFGFPSLDNTGLGKELAEKIGECPELAAAVFEQLKSGGKLYTGQAMLENLTDKQLTEVGTSAEGRQVLSVIKESLAVNIEYQKSWGEFLTTTKKVAADEQRTQRIDRAITEAAETGRTKKTQEVEAANNSIEFQGITEDQLAKAAPALNKDPPKLKEYTRLLNETMKESGIKTPAQQAAFIATCSAETIGFTKMTEGESDFASSKVKYKGRGIIQLTDMDATNPTNYLGASQHLKLGSPDTKPPYKLLVDKPELAAKPEYSFKIAGWFWAEREHKLGIPNEKVAEQPRADLQDFRQASSLVNSGRPMGRVNHWGDRLIHYRNALVALNLEISPEMAANIKKGIDDHTGKDKPHFLKLGELN